MALKGSPLGPWPWCIPTGARPHSATEDHAQLGLCSENPLVRAGDSWTMFATRVLGLVDPRLCQGLGSAPGG